MTMPTTTSSMRSSRADPRPTRPTCARSARATASAAVAYASSTSAKPPCPIRDSVADAVVRARARGLSGETCRSRSTIGSATLS
ncbi:hypothetical protein [Streptomyces sp. NPDC058623]|uniref:hypothetical protein n=1 Tax=Streptomyces sp. NPDC058623 TaxID=3346563 RepID=UPI0036614B30